MTGNGKNNLEECGWLEQCEGKPSGKVNEYGSILEWSEWGQGDILEKYEWERFSRTSYQSQVWHTNQMFVFYSGWCVLALHPLINKKRRVYAKRQNSAPSTSPYSPIRTLLQHLSPIYTPVNHLKVRSPKMFPRCLRAC